MKKLFAVVMIFHSWFNEGSGQNKTYFGVEGAITHDVYSITETGNDLKTGPLMEGLWGFNLGQEITSYFYLESGIIRKYYDSGIGFKSVGISFSGSATDVWIIPLRLVTRLNLYKNKIYFAPVLGYSFCTNSYYGYGNSGTASGSVKSATYSISFNYSENIDLTKHFSLLQTGLGFEFKFFKTVVLSISSSYYTGFKKVIELNKINYTVNHSSTFTGESFTTGDFWSLGAGLKYPISRFWTKKI